jgi:uncharacterized protein YxjI
LPRGSPRAGDADHGRGDCTGPHDLVAEVRRGRADWTRGVDMALLRDRRGGRGDGPEALHFQMREKMFSIGDDYWIETDHGERAFKVNGKALRIRETLAIEDPSGHELFTIQEKKLRVRDTMDIERDGSAVATVKKAMITPLRERFSIDVRGGDDLDAKGNIVDHEYEIERHGHKVAEVSKRWFRMRDTYGIEVAPGEDPSLVLAIAVCIDQMTHD